MPLPAQTAEPCSIHRAHHPKALVCELHHVIPQAWQSTFIPPTDYPERYPGWGSDRRALWDRRVISVCPTGHRNIHWHLVRLMRATRDDDPALAFKAYPGRSRAYQVACDALRRWTAAGGSLTALRERGQLGQS